jgi:hypothetical protein
VNGHLRALTAFTGGTEIRVPSYTIHSGRVRIASIGLSPPRLFPRSVSSLAVPVRRDLCEEGMLVLWAKAAEGATRTSRAEGAASA